IGFAPYDELLEGKEKILKKCDHLVQFVYDEEAHEKRRFDELLAEAEAFFIPNSLSNISDPNKPKSMEGDIIDLLLQFKKEKSTPINIKALDMNVIGSGTSASTIVWAMTSLMKNPKAMKKVQSEIRKLVGKKKKGL
uniref:Cytochrome P450 n=1 Tax=Solanum lycopersicum TaxID=4081 RepID=A0A3Q7HC06_SOLLC